VVAAAIASFVFAFIAAFLATPAFAALAKRSKLVAVPRQERWHRSATPLLGGAAITVGALGALALFAAPSTTTLVVLIMTAATFALGLLDDFRHLTPATKLVGQVLIASGLYLGGIRVDIIPIAPISFLATVFWVVAVMNALNLTDNMDGLAAGLSAIAGITLALTTGPSGALASLVASAVAGAALGFLVHNFSPARVFMGDAGSMTLGVLLAAAALLHTSTGATNVALAIFAPVAVLALPIFDTALVTTLRRIAGRPVSQGGRDHASHRLAALGLTDRHAVLLLYGVAASFAALALFAEEIGGVVLPLGALGVVALILFGTFLAEVDVYERGAQGSGRLAREFYAYLRFGAEVAIDVVLLSVAYYLAYLLRFEGEPEGLWVPLLAQTLPVTVGAQLAVLVALGMYRTLWRYFGLTDILLVIRGITFGTIAAAAVFAFAYQGVGFSRAALLLDWVLAILVIVGARSFLLWLRYGFANAKPQPRKRVLILGANDAGAIALRLLTRTGSPYRPIGFLDDDPGKRNRRLSGMPILGSFAQLETIAERMAVDAVVCALDPTTDGQENGHVEGLRSTCTRLGIEWSDLLLPVSRLAERA
jgi:UDP-GlcNAc:undecaprenyl-phosphate GlcNAc-1-phosphate transferase